MILSDKYTIKEDHQITLYEIVDVQVKKDGKPTGETKKSEKVLGYYSLYNRHQVYKRIINNEISSLEAQTLEKILEVVEQTSEQIMEFFKVQK